MKKSKLKTIIIMILGIILMMLNTNVYAADYSFKTNVSASKTTINAGETMTVTLTASNINMGEEGMHALEGIVTYDKNVFESIDVKGNDWNVTLNSSTGKFVAVNLGTTGTSTSILTATLKAKENLDSTQAGKISFSNITASAGDELINGDAQSVEVTVNAKAGSGTTIPANEQKQSSSKTEQPAKTTEKTTSKSIIPAAGASTSLAIALVLSIIVSIALRRKNKQMKDIK